mmetsp:Transcript_15527/g.21199  ORF Transcript_15527/g.21199 Transcript_15527/m.21199 type:complete len:432 (-) Transcript_15527:303-1598(-)
MSETEANGANSSVPPTSGIYPNALKGEPSKEAPAATAVEQAQKTQGALTMFAPSAPSAPSTEANANDAANSGDGVDLDDLFRDCYFGFSDPISSSDVTTHLTASAAVAPPPPTAAVPHVAVATAPVAAPVAPVAAPPVSVPLVAAAPDAVTSTPVSATIETPQTTAATALKRKAEVAGMGSAVAPLPVTSSATATSYVKRPADSKELTDQQKIERRERNREHAKRSRLRKKFLLESLQEQIHGLQTEIESLKDIIKKELPEKAESLIKTACGEEGNFTPLPMPSGFGPVKTLMEPDFRLMSALSGSQQNFAISDPSLPDNPIVYVSRGFLELTGYTLDQVLGRNCRFLQGPGTDQSAVDIIRRGVREGIDTSVCLLNYKEDGTPFWNQFFVAALRDAEGNVVNFVGVQCEVSKAVVEKHIAENKNPHPNRP